MPMNVRIYDQRDHWHQRATLAEQESLRAEAEARRLRGYASDARTDLLLIERAADALARAVESSDDPNAMQRVAELRAALQGKASDTTQFQNAISIFSVGPVLREMFDRMKTREKLARAAEKWVFEQLGRKILWFQ